MGRQIPRITVTTALVTLVALAASLVLSTGAGASSGSTYVVLYKKQAVPSDASATITKSGGSLVYAYGQIGVAIARSDSATFANSLEKDTRIEGVSSTAGLATRVEDDAAGGGDPIDPGIPAPGADNLSGLQWDMDQIDAPQARAINGGSPSILVGDIDTGLDFTHPDLAPNYDAANSTDCTSGAPTTLQPGNDVAGHGTHTAGTIAAAKNTVGIVGVAPNVKIAGIKSGNDDGFFFPEAVICGFMWAGSHNMKVTNNSYFADPWLFNCKNDPEQRAIWKAERRAIQYAQKVGVVIAAEGNESDDLAHPTQDVTSPDDTTPVTREITNACAVIPVEVPGVVGVTANGNLQLKSYYSSYGTGSAQVIAPGGDRRFQVTSAAVNGRVLSTWPAGVPCAIPVSDSGATYCYLQGTSMASPHAAGVAALIASTGVTSPGAIAARLQGTADPIACPTPDQMAIYANFPSVNNGAPQVCEGDLEYNNFNGHGQINALTALGG